MQTREWLNYKIHLREQEGFCSHHSDQTIYRYPICLLPCIFVIWECQICNQGPKRKGEINQMPAKFAICVYISHKMKTD